MDRSSRGAVVAVALVAGLAAPRAHALDSKKAVTQYSLDVWQAEQGLPESSVQALLQTRDGYLWIGTQEGLVRFDGVRFTVFDKRNSPDLKSNYVQALAESRDGSVWIGTGGGGLSRMKDGRFTTYRAREGLPSDVIWSLLEDRDGSLWIGTAGGGLVRFRDGRFTAFGAAEGIRGRVLALCQDRTGALWIGTDGAGLVRHEAGRFSSLTARQGLPSDTVYAVVEDRDGALWIGTERGLARLRDGAIETYTARHGLQNERVGAIVEDRDGSLWLGTEEAGIVRFRAGRFESFAARDGLSSDSVRCLLEDREGSLWMGTRGGGLDRFKDGRITTYSRREGLSNDIVWAVYEDRRGALWIGTDGGGLNRFAGGRFTAYTTRDGLSHNMVRALVEDRSGALWIGTWGGGLNRFKDGRFTAYTTKDGLAHDQVRAVYEDREGAIWIGTYGGGLNRLENGRFTAYTTRDGLGNDTIYCILEDRDGALWVGTRGGGLSRLRDGVFETFTTRDGLPDDVILSLYEDAEGSLWIGTTGGLARLKNGRVAAVTSRDGLFDDLVYQILEDDRDNLWMSCNRGIHRLAKSEFEDFAAGRIRSVRSLGYGRADGMKSAECNGGVQPAGWRTRDGRLWFPTIRGVVVLDPASLYASPGAPPVVVEEVLNDRRPVAIVPEVTLPPGKGELEFHYTALTFLAPEQVRFRYRLEGFDPDWVQAKTRRVAYYTNIPPGSYRFRVTAANQDGAWDEAGASFGFVLRPPFYRTTWFRALSALGLLLLAAGVYALRIRRLEARQRELMKLVDERTRDLREAIRLKDDVVSVVAHDFRSPLTIVRGYAELLLERAPDEESRRPLKAILTHADHLAALAADTLTMSRIETGDFPLERKPVRLAALVQRVVESRSGAAEVRLDCDDGIVVEGDEDRLYQVIENLVANAVKYSPAGAPIQVSVGRGDGVARVAVADRGYGIPPEELPKLFRRFSRLEAARRRDIPGTGLGLYICRSIVEAHGGRIWAESAPGQGSSFHFELPLQP